MNWYIGQKVVYVDDSNRIINPHFIFPNGKPSVGDICVIAGFFEHPCIGNGQRGLQIVGMPQVLDYKPHPLNGTDVGISEWRFRPLQQLQDEARDKRRNKQPVSFP